MRTENLLVELGTEELPPKALKNLGQAFADNVKAILEAEGFEFANIRFFAAPRRLAVMVDALVERQADKQVEKRGPAVSAAFDADGNPTKAAMGWASANGITVEQAERLVTDKGEWLLHKAFIEGLSIQRSLEKIINTAVSKLPIPKAMRWGDYSTQFIRPVHTLTALYGGEVIDISVLGKRSARTIQGHRFHGESTFELSHANDYETQLTAHYVVASFSKRAQIIAQRLNEKANELGLHADYDQSLLEEIAALVEWPVILTATFDKAFLEVPKEALIYTMKDDQKYVPLLNNDGSLANTFLFVSNIESRDPEQVVKGNEKVIRPRLADAEFFYKTDCKTSLESRLDKLETILFQKQLGTLKEKAERLSALAASIASIIDADAQQSARAGLLAKADLVSNMVLEFPDVQGAMGKYYALNDGEDSAVAVAIEEHYLPRFSGDDLPSSKVSAAVSLADKLDTLIGIFGIGQLPKGDKDPFALRRAAIGIIRIINDLKLTLQTQDIVEQAIAVYGSKLSNPDTGQQVTNFLLTRLHNLLLEEGFTHDVVQSVSELTPASIIDFVNRVKAVQAFKQNDACEALAAANKRVANILAKQNMTAAVAAPISENLLVENEEVALFNAIVSVSPEVAHHFDDGAYDAVLATLAKLRSPIDAFFDSVMVMADDEAIRNNRLSILLELRKLFTKVADISVLV